MRKILFFHARWCNPCKFLEKNTICEVEKCCPDQVERIDVDVRPGYAEKMKILRIPTIVFMDGEREVFRKAMSLEPEKLVAWLNGEKDGID